MKNLKWIALLILGPSALGGCVVVEDNYTPIYDPCFSTSECDAYSDACWEITIDYGDAIVTDAMCSVSCIDDLDCPYGGYCLSIGGERPICYQPCYDDFDCAHGFSCIDTVSALSIDPVCLPY